MGRDYFQRDDPGYASGILVMFNTYALTSSSELDNGFGFELQVKCNTGSSTVNPWVPILGSGRWVHSDWQSGGIQMGPRIGQPVSIRLFLTRSRILDSFGPHNNPDLTAENMVVKGIRAKVGIIGHADLNKDEELYLKESTLSALALRTKKAT